MKPPIKETLKEDEPNNLVICPKALGGDFFYVQWNLLNKDTLGPAVLSFVERLSSFRGDFLWSVYTRSRVLSACPLSTEVGATFKLT